MRIPLSPLPTFRIENIEDTEFVEPRQVAPTPRDEITRVLAVCGWFNHQCWAEGVGLITALEQPQCPLPGSIRDDEYLFHPPWEQMKRHFEPDGTLAHLTVQDTTIDEWRLVLFALDVLVVPVKVMVDGEHQEGLKLFTSDFLIQQDQEESLHASIELDMNTINLHFFQEDEIFFDFDWYDIFDQEMLNSLFDFMTFLHHVTRKPVVIERGFFRCDASTSHRPAGPFFANS